MVDSKTGVKGGCSWLRFQAMHQPQRQLNRMGGFEGVGIAGLVKAGDFWQCFRFPLSRVPDQISFFVWLYIAAEIHFGRSRRELLSIFNG